MTSLLLVTFSSISQTNTPDSVTCLPNSTLRKVIKDIEAGKITLQKLQATERLLSITNERLAGKDSTIRIYQKKDSAWLSLDKSYKLTIRNFEQAEGLRNELVDRLNRDLKAQKRKTTLYQVLTGTFIGTTAYLAVKLFIIK